MQYMLLIYGDENGWDSMSEEERGQVMQAYMALHEGAPGQRRDDRRGRA